MAKIKTYKIDLSNLRQDEQSAVELLEEVGKEIHKIWEKQVLPTDGRITLYDQGISRDEIIHASEADKSILSPYTVVRRGDDGSLYSVPYTQEYKEGIQKIISLLKDVEKVSKDFWFKKYVRNIYKSWEKGDFDTALVEYLVNDNSKIGILMGPIENYSDKLMGIKKTFQFNLRIKRDRETHDVERIIEITKKLPIIKPYLSAGRDLGEGKIHIRVDDVLMFSGRQAGTRSASTNLPNEVDLVKKYGTRVVVYQNSLDEKFTKLFSPFFSKFTGHAFKLESAKMKEAATRLIILHEVCEGLIQFPDAKGRLQGNESAVREFNAYLMGVKSSMYHSVKGILTMQEFQEIQLMNLIVGLDKFSRMEVDSSVYEYARGYAVMYNYLESIGAITISKAKVKVDYEKLAQGIDSLASVVLSIYHESKYEESQKLFDTYGSFDVMKRLPLIKS